MRGPRYLEIIRARRLALNNSLTTVIGFHRGYAAAASELASTQGERPTGFFTTFSVVPNIAWAQLDSQWAARMSIPADRLRIALIRAIEGIGLQDRVVGERPTGAASVLAQLGTLITRGRTELRWYLNSPVSRHDSKRPFFERLVRLDLAMRPLSAWAIRSAGADESAFATGVVYFLGAEVPRSPETAAERFGPEGQEYGERQVVGRTGDPEGLLRSIGKGAVDVGEVAGSFAQLLSRVTGGGNGGPGFGEILAIVGGVTVVGLVGYTYVKSRPTIMAATAAHRRAKAKRAAARQSLRAAREDEAITRVYRPREEAREDEAITRVYHPHEKARSNPCFGFPKERRW